MKQFGFNGNLHNIPLKKLRKEYLGADKRGHLRVNPTKSRVEGTFIPYPTLPICSIGSNTRFLPSGRSEEEWGIVAVQGSILSTISMKAADTTPGAYSGTTPTGGTIEDAFGIPKGIDSWVVLCNGGNAATYTYTALDEENETIKNMDGDEASAGDTVVFGANKPIGIATEDFYQTKLPGQYLNNSYTDKVVAMVDGLIEVPFYNGDITSYLSDANYKKLCKNFIFGYVASGTTYSNGALVKSDQYGKYLVDDSTTLTQYVGKAMEYSKRGPLSENDIVQGHYESSAASDKTAGYPSRLFWFVYDALNYKNSSAPTVAEVATAIESGSFGLVRILVDIG